MRHLNGSFYATDGHVLLVSIAVELIMMFDAKPVYHKWARSILNHKSSRYLTVASDTFPTLNQQLAVCPMGSGQAGAGVWLLWGAGAHSSEENLEYFPTAIAASLDDGYALLRPPPLSEWIKATVGFFSVNFWKLHFVTVVKKTQDPLKVDRVFHHQYVAMPRVQCGLSLKHHSGMELPSWHLCFIVEEIWADPRASCPTGLAGLMGLQNRQEVLQIRWRELANGPSWSRHLPSSLMTQA